MTILTTGIYPLNMSNLRVQGTVKADLTSLDEFHLTVQFRDDLSIHSYFWSPSYNNAGNNAVIYKYEALTSGWNPILTIDQMSITIATYNSFTSRGDVLGLFAYIFRGDDVLNGNGASILRGFNGNDTYVVASGDIIIETATGGRDTVQTYGDFTLGANLENLTLLGGNGTSGTGNSLNNIISGSSNANILSGLGGNDLFRFGINGDRFLGNDTIDGGTGSDQIQVYTMFGVPQETISDEYFTSVHSVETLRFMSGYSTINVSLGINSEAAGINRVDIHDVWFNDWKPILVDASERSLAITLVGTPLGDTLKGGAGKDAMAGGGGNDTYYAGAGDVLSESASGGIDAVFSADSFVLANYLENLTLTGSAHVNATGNASANVLTGNSGDNILNGGAAADKLTGGLGNDTYVVDNAGDQITEASDGGVDLVKTSIANLTGGIFSIESRPELENVTLLGTMAKAYGNAKANALTGNASANTLDGKGGADAMEGMGGNDTYVVDDAGDAVSESTAGTAGGNDLVLSSVSFTLGSNVERLTLTGITDIDGAGNNLANTINGNEGKNRLDGAAGADDLRGGLGNDTYVVDSASDKVTELLNQGDADTVEAWITLTLVSNVEHLTLIGTANINATGNALNNTLTGNSGKNTLDGKTGADTLKGGLGDDIYIFTEGDTIVEAEDAGSDTVQIGRSVNLNDEFDNVENVTLTIAGAFNLTGDEANNILRGNASANTLKGDGGNDRLEGGAGVDTLEGGEGNDTYVLNGADIILVDTGGNDTVEVAAHYLVLREDLENITLLGTAALNAKGNDSVNILKGTSAANILDGQGGADRMEGGAGGDTYYVDHTEDEITESLNAGSDRVFSSANYALSANIESLQLTGDADINGTGNALNNTITGNAGKNRLDGGTGNDSMIGGLGDDVYVVDSTLDKITENLNAGEDTVESWVTYTLATNVDHLQLMGTATISATGNALTNILTGNDGNNTLDGKGGADTMTGGAGDDIYVLDNVGDNVIETGGGTDAVQITYAAALGPQITLGVGKFAGIENATAIGTGAFHFTGDAGANALTGNASANILEGQAGNDILDGKGGADTLYGGEGDDLYRVDNALDNVVETAPEHGEDTVESTVTYRLDARPAVEHVILKGTSTIHATGNALANELTGNGAANTLTGLGGNDTLDGLGGNDRLIGGLGDDTYYVNATGDVVLENADEGADVIFSSASYTLVLNVEELRLTGVANLNATGNAADNFLYGNLGNNILDGKAGIDTLAGGGGNDTYVVDHNDDEVVEGVDAGIDLVKSSVSDYELADNVENLALVGNQAFNGTGNDLDNTITGNAAVNILFGGAGNDTLNGAGGADIMVGGLDDDTYIVDNVNDSVMESEDEGTDLVQSTITYTLAADVENATLLGAGAIGLTGNEMGNILTGNAGVNTLNGAGGNDTLVGNAGNDTLNGGDGNDELNGGAGSDTMRGGRGDDLYHVDSISDKVIESTDEGVDTVLATISLSLDKIANVEKLILGGTVLSGTGNAADNSITGNGNNNTLSGGLGNDTLIGGMGNDTYIVDSAADVVVELENEGIDAVQTTATITLAENVENALLRLSASIGVTGNALNNAITGNDGNNSLHGLAGNDTLIGNAGNDELDGGTGNDGMQGGAGNDIYHVDAIGDVITELANGGTDTVLSAISYQLAANIENLTLASGAGAIHGTGNALANILTGNEGDNTLDGGAGTDAMVGGDGDDVYIVDTQGDQIIELAGEGNDTVQVSFGTSFDLSSTQDVENMVLLGTVLAGQGNALGNTITGNAAANQLSGGAGDDRLNGGAGNDTLMGGEGNDVLDGQSGTDTMSGGSGDDAYYVDSTSDIVTEESGGGNDAVYATVSYVLLSTNVEQLILAGSSAINGTGSAGNDTIKGNSAANILDGAGGDDTLLGEGGDDTLRGAAGNDVLDGGTGNDVMEGGSGNDTYVVDSLSDQVTENANAGTDAVQAAFSYELGAQVEDLVLLGTNSIDGTGNALSNRITGNAGNNRLDGKSGIDTMIGGDGDDTYVVDAGGDVVIEEEGNGNDVVRSSVTYTLAAHVEELIITQTSGTVTGTGNTLDNRLENQSAWAATLNGGAGNDILVGGAGSDTFDFTGATGADFMIGGTGDDTYYVDDEGDVVTEAANGGADKVVIVQGFNGAFTTPDNVENADVGASLTTGRELIGNSLHNTLTGALGDDTLRGGEGNDTLIGGAGNDTLEGGAGIDTLIGGAGDDTYLMSDALSSVIESLGEGSDTIEISVTYTLAINVEKLTLLGTSNIDGTGTSQNNTIVGNAGNNRLDGKAGADTLVGLGGNDTYVVDNTGDIVIEAAGEGQDTVRTSVDYSLSAHVENMALTAYRITVIGNDLDNIIGMDGPISGLSSWFSISGGAGNDVLLGGAGDDDFDSFGSSGADTMTGNEGNDTYHVDNNGDIVEEYEVFGSDSVTLHSGFVGAYVLGAFVESAFIAADYTTDGELVGNSLDNVLFGGTGSDILRGQDGDDLLNGLEGADDLFGGEGDDIFYFSEGDTVEESADSGVDTVRTDLDLAWLMNNVENLEGLDEAGQLLSGNDLDNHITGNSGDDVLSGFAGNDVLEGGAGADQMIGGLGDDQYILIQGAEDTIVELASEGLDSVLIYSTAINSTFYLSAEHVENLTLAAGAGLENAHGNALNNTLTGNSSSNILHGEAGNDTLDGGMQGLDDLYGGEGDDLYVVRHQNAEIFEYEDNGTDSVESFVDFNLPDNVENLKFKGDDWISASGNSLDNVLVGNSGNNVLHGLGGNDLLDGGSGGDRLYGGDGDDVLVFSPFDVYDGGVGSDTLKLAGTGQSIDFNSTWVSITDVEIIDLTGLGDNYFSAQLGHMTGFSSTTGVLRIKGDAGDTVTSTGWESNFVLGTVVDNGVTYDTYTLNAEGSPAFGLWVAQDVDVFLS